MESSTRLNLAYLHEDVLFHICSFLDQKTISLLTQVCKSLRDKLYHPVIWMNTVLALFEINEAVADSLKTREIRSAILMNLSGSESENITPNSISNLMTVDTLETLVVQQSCAKSLRFSSGLYELIPGFDSLRCLVLFLERDKFQTKSKTQFHRTRRRVNAPQLVITQQIIHRLDHNGSMTLLKDLEFKSLYGDWSVSRHCDKIYLDPTHELDRRRLRGVCNDLSSLERLAGVNLSIVSIAQIEELSKYFPRLKHMELEMLDMELAIDSIDRAIDPKRIRPNVLQNIESLVITVYHDVGHDYNYFLSYFPNIRALSLRCAVYPEPNTERLYIRQITEWSLRQNLLVLHIFADNFFYMSLETSIRNVICNLKNLQVFILPTLRYSVELVSDIVKNLGMLKSLIGILSDDQIDSLSSLVYKTSPHNHYKVVKRVSAGSTWEPIRLYSDDWCEARGMKFFYPPESIRNLKLTHSTWIYQQYRRKYRPFPTSSKPAPT